MSFSVSELNEQAKALLESNFFDISVEGEISRFVKNASSGHWYFSLKDEKSVISVAMFKTANQKVKFLPEDGIKVVLNGKISLYSPSGTYQFIANSMSAYGQGDLDLAFNQLKQKLEKEGLFDAKFKKPLPKFPKKVGIITSITSAAFQDMIKTANDRGAFCKFYAYNALMQGFASPKSVMDALKKADSAGYDAIIIARGGGSKEDLFCFNDEELARAIFNVKTPIISAIGHEIDFSISDFVSDKRSQTPTAAIMDLLPDKFILMQELDYFENSFKNFIFSKIQFLQNKIENFRILIKNRAIIEKFDIKLKEISQKELILKSNIKRKIENLSNFLSVKEAVLNEKRRFFEVVKDLNKIQKDGKNIALKDLKSGDEITISSLDCSKKAVIK